MAYVLVEISLWVLLRIVGYLLLLAVAAVGLAGLLAAATRRGGSWIVRIVTYPVEWIARILSGPVRAGLHALEHTLAREVSQHGGVLAAWLLGVGDFYLGWSKVQAVFAEAVEWGFREVKGRVIPREIGRVAKPIDRKAKKALGLGLAGLAGLEALLRWSRQRINREIKPAIRHLVHETTVALPRELGRIRTRERALERTLEHPSTRWLRRIAKWMWVAVFLGLLVKTLARKFPWLFCRQTQSVGKRICSLDAGLLESLLADTLVFLGVFSLLDFANALKPFVGLLTAGLRDLLTDANAAWRPLTAPDRPGTHKS